MSSSWFEKLQPTAAIEIFALSRAFKEDSFEKKVDLGIGAYRTNEAKPWVLPVVKKVEQQLAADETRNHEYLGQLGLESFTQAATKMLLGADSPAVLENRALGVQTLSGTGSLRLAADFLRDTLNTKTVYISKPSWDNHKLLFKHSGYTDIREYRYWKAETRGLDFEGLIEDLNAAPANSVIILHACAHNPTGVDPEEKQWEKIADVIEKRRLFPLFDSAYQGFASGDLDRDAFAVRLFVKRGLELFTAQSFAKNFGLYDERAGNLTIVVHNPSLLVNIRSHLALYVRGNYSNPPAHGARIVSKVLNTPELYAEWTEHIKEMSQRILKMRKELRDRLEKLGTPGTWEHITSQIGMFSFTGLTEIQCQQLVNKYHVYLPKSGRISICGINTNNIEYLAKAIDETVRNTPKL